MFLVTLEHAFSSFRLFCLVAFGRREVLGGFSQCHVTNGRAKLECAERLHLILGFWAHVDENATLGRKSQGWDQHTNCIKRIATLGPKQLGGAKESQPSYWIYGNRDQSNLQAQIEEFSLGLDLDIKYEMYHSDHSFTAMGVSVSQVCFLAC